jgi:hypothetical protein
MTPPIASVVTELEHEQRTASRAKAELLDDQAAQTIKAHLRSTGSRPTKIATPRGIIASSV